MKYEVVIEYDPETDAFTGKVAGLPIIVDANSEEEALQMAKKGIEIYFEEERKDRRVPHRQRPAYAKVVTVEVDASNSR